MTTIPAYAGYIFDLDGTLYLGPELIPGADRTIQTLAERGAKVMFISNKPIDTAQNYAAKLTKFGIPASACNVMTSPLALADYMAAHHKAPRVFVLGEEPVIEALEAVGCRIVDKAHHTDIVVVSWERKLTYNKFNEAFQALRQGALYYVTNPDVTCPMPNGAVADTGANIAGLTACSGREPDFIAGKPHAGLARAAMTRMSVKPAQTLLTGDRLQTDLMCGKNAGCATAIVLTGVSSQADIEALPKEQRPDYVIDSVADLV